MRQKQKNDKIEESNIKLQERLNLKTASSEYSVEVFKTSNNRR